MQANLHLLPFQDGGVDWLAAHTRAMLAWDPGVGKTPTAVKACDRIKAARVLVFCPPIVSHVWSTHFRDWSDQPYDIRILRPADAVTPYTFIEGQGIVRIVPYSYCSREMHENLINALVKFSDQWDVVILDEVHNLKNPDAKRTRIVYGPRWDLAKSACEGARHIWTLSGTPMLNNAGELWTHFHALRPDLIEFSGKPLDQTFFLDRYCVVRATPYGQRILGTRNTTELAEKAKRFMHRRRLRDVLPELPELRITEYELPEDTPLSEELREKIEEITDAIELECADDDELLAAVQSASVFFSTARRLIGHAKVPGVSELARNDLEGSDGKLIVFAHHRDVIADLAKHLKAFLPLVITGSTSIGERVKLIHSFQTDPAYRLIILAIDAAGEGITLHAAHNVILAEPSPVPGRNAQAIARAHRKGQKHPVLARFVTLPGTIDQRLMNIIARKTRDILRVIDPDLAKPEPKQEELFPEKI